MKKIMKRIAVLLVIALVAQVILPSVPAIKGLTSQEVNAAAKKASIENKNQTIGITSVTPGYIYINNRKDSATYSYKSKDTKIAKVDKYGTITGVKKGSTKITVTEKNKGKTTTVGTVTVKVVGPKLISKTMEVGAGGYSNPISIEYYNKKAKYTFKSADTNIATVDEDGYIRGVKAGTTTVSVSEKYKGKTTKLGSVKVNVVQASLREGETDISMGVNSTSYLTYILSLNYQNYNATYTAESADPSVISGELKTDDYGDTYFILNALAVGTTTLTIYEEYQGEKRSLGTINVKVIEIPVESFIFYSDYLDVEDGLPTKEVYLDDTYSSFYYNFEKDPWDATDIITYTVADPTIATVDKDGNITPLKVGKTKVTVTCGKFSHNLQISVIEYEDDYYDWD